MSILKDISDILKDLKSDIDETGVKEYGKRLQGSSIARKGAEGTLQFPAIVSKSISIDTAMIICRALEAQYASFTQVALSLNPYLDLSKDKDVAAYLKNFHQNSGGRFSTIGDLLLENANSLELENLEVDYIITNGSGSQVTKNNKEQMFSALDYVNENCLNNVYKPTQPKVNFKNNDLNEFFNNRLFDVEIVTEAKKHKKNNNNVVKRDQFNYEYGTHNAVEYDNDVFKQKDFELKNKQYEDKNKQFGLDFGFKKDRSKVQDKQWQSNYDQKQAQIKYQKDRDRQSRQDEITRMNVMNMGNTQVKMTDNDCRKANDLVPTTLAVSVNVKDGHNFGGTVNFLVGIKVIMHPVTSEDMVRNMALGYRKSNKFFNFLRWTTGEISFVKDFVLNVNEIREDVLNRTVIKDSRWWSVLKRRKNAAKARRLIPTVKEILPNTTVVLSLDEVELIKSEYGFDLSVPSIMSKIMQEYFLLGMVIVDESQELATFMFDGQVEPEVISFSSLERTNSNRNDFKEIYKMINSGRL